jgi:hypothetical protein
MVQKAIGLRCLSEQAKVRMKEIVAQVHEWHAGDYPRVEVPAPAMFQLLEALDKDGGSE